MEYYNEAVVVPLIIAMTEVAKKFGFPKKYAAVFSWLLGLMMAFVYVTPGDLKGTFFVGSALGLSASGLFSGTKSAVQRK